MPKPLNAARLPFLGLALLLALLLAALGGTGFQRKIERFQSLGFEFEARQGTWLVTRAEPETNLRAGDGILREEAVASEGQLRERLARQAETALLVQRDGGVENVLYQRPALTVDFAYLILVAVGVLYLLIGLYTALKDSRAPARLFYFWCLLSAAFYVLSPPVIPRDGTDELIFLVDQWARILLPAVTLHLFLVFPTPLVTSRAGRFALPGLYLPAAVLVAFHADQIFRGGALFGPATGRTLAWVDRLEIWLLVAFALVGVLVLFARLAARPIWEQRRQMHWILLGMVGGYVPFLALYVVPWSLGLDWPSWTVMAAVLALGLVPLGFAYAILKYKLWDIGVILRDSIAYSLTVLVGLCGFAFIQMALERGLGDDLTTARNFLTFAAGLAIAGVLVPTKSAISTGLERWQYRRRLPQRRELDQLGDELLHERDLTRLCSTLIDRLTNGLNAYANLYLVQSGGVLVPVLAGAEIPERITPDALGDELWRRDVAGLSPAELPGEEPTVKERLFAAGYRYAFPLLVREHRVGILLVSYRFDDEPLNSEDLELTRGLLNQASLAIENAHLLEEVRLRLDEVSRLEEHNKGIIDSSPAGIAVIDRDDRVVSANQAFSAVAGVPAAELSGRLVEEVLPVRPLPEPGDGLVEVSYSDLSGREHYLQLAVAPHGPLGGDRGGVHGEAGADLRILIVQDTSQLIAMELALKEKERLAALGLLAAGVAHEVNTPLTGISSYAQLLLADVGEGHPHHEVLKKLERQTFRAAQIVNNLLEFARNRHDELGPVSLPSVVEECFALLGERLREAGVEAEWHAPTPPPRVLGNEGELHQVFNNLMVNAIDAMAPRGGGRLTVRLAVDGERIVARVTDTGPGIPPERLERIFQPFFSSKWGKGGTGLGLAITYNLIQRHRGTIRAENHPGGRGCTFLIELPCHAVH